MDTELGSSEISRHEDRVTSSVEKVTANIPSIGFLALAGVSVLGSLSLFLLDRKLMSLFVGQWAPTFLLLGVYNKLVKQQESVQPLGDIGTH